MSNVSYLADNYINPDADRPAREPHKGQVKFAERFTRDYGDKFIYAHGIGWHEWDGARFAEDLDGAPQRGVVKLIKDALVEVAQIEDKDKRKPLLADITKVESAGGIKGVLEVAKNEHPCTIAAAKLDSDPDLLNTPSGTANLDTGEVKPPSPADRLTKVTNGRLVEDAHSKLFDEFLEMILPDPEMRGFLARSLGSALLGRVQEHKLFVWYGDGANGKGTLRDAVRYALGDYAIEVPADILLASKYGPNAMAPERMRLRGVRVAFCSETGEDSRFDEAAMKKLTGGDPINACLKYHNPVEFKPSHQLFMLTNKLPRVSSDPAVWRRLLAVPFNVVVPDAQQDVDLPKKLMEASDAVLAWLWQGWLDYQKHGLNPPEAVLNATQKYKEDSDVLARFLNDSGAVVLGDGEVGSSQFYAAFGMWMARQGEKSGMTQKTFTAEMEKRGYKKARTPAGMVWKGVTLVTHATVEPNLANFAAATHSDE